MSKRKLDPTHRIINAFLDLPVEEAARLHQYLGVVLARQADRITPKGSIRRGQVKDLLPPEGQSAVREAPAPAPPPARRRRRPLPAPVEYGEPANSAD